MNRVQHKIIMGSAALVLGSILVAASVHFVAMALLWCDLDLCDLGLTIRFMKTVE